MIVDLLVLWWVSDPISRIPKDISQVAYILKISKGKLNQLLNGEEFQGKLDSMRMQRYSRVLPLLEKRMMIKALEGNSDAENWLRNVYRKIDARRTSQDITLGVDEKLLDMLEKGNINLPVEMDDKDVSAIVYREIINQ